MLLEKDDVEKQQFNFFIKPNRSTTVKGMIAFVALVGLAVFLVAMRFVILGAWVILPFAILEIALLAAGFWLFERSTRYRETVTVTKDSFCVTKLDLRGETSWSFNPHWVQVMLKRDPKDWYPSRLLISAQGKQVEIGACLINKEREELLMALNRAVPAVLK